MAVRGSGDSRKMKSLVSQRRSGSLLVSMTEYQNAAVTLSGFSNRFMAGPPVLRALACQGAVPGL